MNLQPISGPMTATELRDRALASMNGESRALSATDRKRRERILSALRKGKQ
jgi:hypothetical protein